MDLELTWRQAAARLALTILAGMLIGFNRGKGGHVAGMRTNILVAIAACVSMLQVDALLPLAGKPASSFVVMDLMRLPLGILSGMGFIGAGAILKKRETVVGVTTAATLWLMTVVGLCMGGGQLGLGCSATAIAAVVLSAMKHVDTKVSRDRYATLVVVGRGQCGVDQRVQRALALAGFGATYRGGSYGPGGRSTLHYLVTWRGAAPAREPADVIAGLQADFDVEEVRWNVAPTDGE